MPKDTLEYNIEETHKKWLYKCKSIIYPDIIELLYVNQDYKKYNPSVPFVTLYLCY